MGYYLLTQFLHYENRDIAYVPPKLIKDTLQFFDTQCRYLCELLNEIKADYTKYREKTDSDLLKFMYYKKMLASLKQTLDEEVKPLISNL